MNCDLEFKMVFGRPTVSKLAAANLLTVSSSVNEPGDIYPFAYGRLVMGKNFVNGVLSV
ncbi:MAG: hypothetical protein AAFY17_10180 [Cyanobacteria bacterium J06642_11]